MSDTPQLPIAPVSWSEVSWAFLLLMLSPDCSKHLRRAALASCVDGKGIALRILFYCFAVCCLGESHCGVFIASFVSITWTKEEKAFHGVQLGFAWRRHINHRTPKTLLLEGQLPANGNLNFLKLQISAQEKTKTVAVLWQRFGCFLCEATRLVPGTNWVSDITLPFTFSLCLRDLKHPPEPPASASR